MCSTQPGERHGTDSLGLWSVTGLVVVALLLRATRLDESLWYDEIAAWFSYGVHGPGVIIGDFFEPSNHVAHTLLSWCAVRLLEGALGFELALRLPALLFSLGAVAATYGMVRCVSPRGVALVAAALMALLPVAVLEGAEARGYSMMICLSALANWAFLANLSRPRTWRWLLYAGLCAAGVWAHPVTAFVPIGHAAWLGWRAAHHGEIALLLRGGTALALAAAVTVTLYAPIIGDMLSRRAMFTAARGGEPSVLGTEGFHALLQLGGSWYAWAAWPGLGLAILGAIGARRANDGPLLTASAVTLLGLPIFMLAVIVAGSWMYARFALFGLPGAAMLAAAGIDLLRRWRPAAAGLAGALLCAASVADLAVRPAKQPLRDAAEYVRRNGGGTVLVIGLAHRVLDVYLADLEPQYSLRHGADLEQILGGTDPDWIVLYYPNHVGPSRYALLDERGYAVAAVFRGWVDWTNGDVLVYAR